MIKPQLRVVRAMPNPFGKDRTFPVGHLPGEWVDIRNVGTCGVPKSSVEVWHLQFGLNGVSEWASLGTLPVALAPGQSVRIHSIEDLAEVPSQLLLGNDVVTGHNRYVWNNDGDTILLTIVDQEVDRFEYVGPVADGQVLYRDPPHPLLPPTSLLGAFLSQFS